MYQLAAFVDEPFSGNPAAVVPTDHWLDASLMQSIAAENNLSETAFVVPDPDGDHAIRWFTPTTEVDLCGHATLAGGAVVLARLDAGRDAVTFASRSGPLTVGRDGDHLTLEMPAARPIPCAISASLVAGLGVEPTEVLDAPYALAVFDDEAAVRAIEPDFAALNAFGKPVIVSAPGDHVDFVSRFFAPTSGVPEDPVTGSAHRILTPYWSERLGKARLDARQVSSRGGSLTCEDRGDRVLVAGDVRFYLEGTIEV